MQIPLRTPVAKILFLILCLMVATGYLALASSQYLAYRLAAKEDLRNLQLAARLEPLDAEYQYKLGRFLTLTQRLPEAQSAFRYATELNPHDAAYWLALASSDAASGQEQDQRQALERAVAANPKSYRVAWEAGNSDLVEGDLHSALREFRAALEDGSPLSGQVIALCWQATPDVDVLLQEAIPPAAYSSFLEFLVSRREGVAAAKVWKQIVTLGTPTTLSDVSDYVRYLIGQHEPAQAREVWQQAGPLCDLNAYQPSTNNLVVNGDFSLDVLNTGFDWTYQKRADVNLALDPTQSHLVGHRSLLISYDSRGLDDTGIHQLIPVGPDTNYHFSAYFKTRQLEGAGGPKFALQDFYTQKPFFESADLKDSNDWKLVSGDFETEHDTELLLLRIKREPVGRAIRGDLWIDGVSLGPRKVQSVQ
jgi:tetratricopeptide (TPR) repeat protein